MYQECETCRETGNGITNKCNDLIDSVAVRVTRLFIDNTLTEGFICEHIIMLGEWGCYSQVQE